MYVFIFFILCTLLCSVCLLKNRSFLYSILICIFMFLIILYAKDSFEGAKQGLELWLYTIVPSLFPFMIVSTLLIHFGFVEFIGILLEPIMQPLFRVKGCGAFALAMGMSCGYPVGAKITSNLREKSLITKEEAERLIAFSNNSGPLFVLGAVSIGMFHLPTVGYFLLLIHYLSSFTVGLLFRYYKYQPIKQNKFHKESLVKKAFYTFTKDSNKSSKTFGFILGDSIKESIQLILQIGGFIIIFSVLMEILQEINFIDFIGGLLKPLFLFSHWNENLITGILKGIIEITNGIKDISSTNAPLFQQLCTSSLLIAWSGFSIHFQTISIISKTDIKVSIYIFAKILQSILAFLYTSILYPFFSEKLQHSILTFSPYQEKFSFNNQLNISFFHLSIALVFLIISALLITIITSLSKK